MTTTNIAYPGQNLGIDFWKSMQGADPVLYSLEDIDSQPDDFERLPQNRESFGKSASVIRMWVDALFEADDILEVRPLPSKQQIRKQQPRQFSWYSTRKRHGFYPWIAPDELVSVSGQLESFNQSTDVLFGMWDKIESKWTDPCTVPNTPLNIYISLNPRFPKGSHDNDVLLFRSLFADLDQVDVEEALRRVDGANLPHPTVIVGSGHGVHLYWRLAGPIIDGAEWKFLQKRLILALDSDPAIHDPARIVRVPGFMNVNGDPSPCVLVEAEKHRQYELHDLDRVLPRLSRQSTKNPIAKPQSPAGEWLSHVGLPASQNSCERAMAYQRAFSAPAAGERNSKTFDLVCNVVEKFGLSVEQAGRVAEAFSERMAVPLDSEEVEEVTTKAFRKVADRRRLPQVFRFETLHEKNPLISLEDWRAEMKAARLASLDQPGAVFADCSPTGAGKSHADRAAMSKAEQSVTFLPTHHACQELASNLIEANLDAAAYPPLDETTCLRFGTEGNPGDAHLAQQAGINVGEAICPHCPFYRGCEYQTQREAARNAKHAIATHARASSSGFVPAEEKPIIFIHENPIALLRPTVRITQQPTFAKAGGRQRPHKKHLEEMMQVAKKARDIAESLGDDEKLDFSRGLYVAAKELLAILDQPVIEPINRIETIPLKGRIARPEGAEWLLHEAMQGCGVYAKGDVKRLVVGHACGELESLSVVIDDTKAKGGRVAWHKSLLGVWRVDPPGHAVVWFEDATGRPEMLSELIGRAVCDRTPLARLEYLVPAVQYAECDVKQSTESSTVRGIVRGLLADHPSAKKVGIITQRCHVQAIRNLGSPWRGRIAHIEYFGSGKDRASNSWLDCDLLLVLGTPRVPPAAVREALVQVGRIEVAGQEPCWGEYLWEGKSQAGDLKTIDAQGYDLESWQVMHSMLVRDALVQALGRGRGHTEKGVATVVASSEPLTLPLADQPLRVLSEKDDETLRYARELTVRISKGISLGKVTVSESQAGPTFTTAALLEEEWCGDSRSTLQRHLSSLFSFGLLHRRGQRGGWLLSKDWFPELHDGD